MFNGASILLMLACEGNLAADTVQNVTAAVCAYSSEVSCLHSSHWLLSFLLESIMRFSPLLSVVGLLCSTLQVNSVAIASGGKPNVIIKPYEGAVLQNIVTWDEHSVFVRGERVLLYNGEFHPYRLPVPSLWLDVFQKIKALGFSGVSFYVDWALLEGQEGNFTAEGVFALEPFFQAASEAGIYLVARPGPYINAEVSGGGYPGWLSRYKAIERTPDYVQLTQNYVQSVSKILAKAQITNGGRENQSKSESYVRNIKLT